MAQVYALKLNSNPDDILYRSLCSKVSVEKRDKIGKFLRREDALRCLFADLLARYMLMRNKGVKNEEISFCYSSYGKPFYNDHEHCHFNISHSGEWLVCVTDDEPVGIDVELIAPIDMEVAENYFSKKECEQLFSLSLTEQTIFFYDLWTCKESYLKLNGMGLSAPLDSFTVSIDQHGMASVSSEAEMRQQVFLKQYDIDKKYKMAVCGSKDSFGKIEFLSIEEMCSFFM